MKAIIIISYALAAIFSSCSAFSPPSKVTSVCRGRGASLCLHKNDSDHNNHNNEEQLSDRRSVIFNTMLLPLSILETTYSLSAKADAGKGKVVVFGGSGWVGAHVSSNLSKKGYQVVSISRSSSDVQNDRTKSILGTTIDGVQYISLDAGKDDLSSVMKDSLAVISCVGVAPGSPNVKEGNGLVNTRIAKAAKASGVNKFVYIGVSSELANGPARFLLGDYFKGKAEAEKSVAQEFVSDKSLIVKPAIVEGGTPGEIRPPGPPGVKPINVESLAKVVVAGAVGDLTGSIDGNEAISAMAF